MNAIFYEIASSEHPDGLLHQFLTGATFPFTEAKPTPGEAEVMVEQSFSDFGDADALVLLRHPEEPCSVFVEAKVKTFQCPDWRVTDEFATFVAGLNNGVSSSNLFAQLYHKWRMVEAMRHGRVPRLEAGVPFPAWSSKRLRKIGENGVVLDAARRLESNLGWDRLGRVFYLAIVPDPPERVRAYFPSVEPVPHPTLAGCWDVTTFGYLTWSQVRTFCGGPELGRVMEVLNFNAGQIDCFGGA